MGEQSETSPARMSAAMKATRIVALRAAGVSWADCAKAVGFAGAGSAYNAAKRWLNRQQYEDRQLMRQIDGERYDRLMKAVWARALQGDLPAFDRVLKIMDARQELFGLKAPVKVVIENAWLDEEIRTLCAELGVSDPRDIVEAPTPAAIEAGQGAADEG